MSYQLRKNRKYEKVENIYFAKMFTKNNKNYSNFFNNSGHKWLGDEIFHIMYFLANLT